MRPLRHTSRMLSLYKRRNEAHTGINLVSMMDIFTILVFFLLIHSSDMEILPSSKSVQLPESVAEKKPKLTVTVVVNDRDIIVQGRRVALVQDVIHSASEVIPALQQQLAYQYNRELKDQDPSQPFKGKVTIMGDKKIPYLLLKKIMLTCTQSRYTQISLAVVQKFQEPG